VSSRHLQQLLAVGRVKVMCAAGVEDGRSSCCRPRAGLCGRSTLATTAIRLCKSSASLVGWRRASAEPALGRQHELLPVLDPCGAHHLYHARRKKLLEMTGWTQAVPIRRTETAAVLADRPSNSAEFYTVGASFASPEDEHFYGWGRTGRASSTIAAMWCIAGRI